MAQPRSFFRRDVGRSAVSPSDTSDLNKPHKPSVSPSKTCPPNVLPAHFLKSTSRDTAVTISAVCTKAPNIPLTVATGHHDRQDHRPRSTSRDGFTESDQRSPPIGGWGGARGNLAGSGR